MKSAVPILACLVWLAAPGSGAAGGLPGGPLELDGPGTKPIGVVEAPVIGGEPYAITGTVAYQGVEGIAYLEMWSVFPDGSRYFSRTLDTQGPLASLHGTSPARPFTLPFFLTPGAPHPVRLELNLVLPAAGHVTLAALTLRSGDAALRAPGAWWSSTTSGWLGGALGGAVGLLGAGIGTLSSLGRGRRVAIAGLLALGVAGLLLLVAGGVALVLGQPYEVWYPLLLIGVLDPVIAFSLLPGVRRRFEALELRRMSAMDGLGR